MDNLLFPTRNLCFFCKARTEDIREFICPDCRSLLEIVHKEVESGSNYIDRVYFTLNYNRFTKELVHRFKFNSHSYLYKPLASLMMGTISKKDIEDIDLIMFIPIHWRKEAIRGYNQSELLASYISKSLDIPISNKNLIKRKWTKEQNKLDKISRLKNLKDSFYVKNPSEIYDKNILLIDDIITTGTTFDESSKLLMENGAKKIMALALTSSR